MLIIDGHQDIASGYLELGRDFRQPVAATRAREEAHTPGGICTLGLPEALRGGVGIVFATLFVAPAEDDRSSYPSYHNADEAYELAHRQLDHYYELAHHPQITLVRCRNELHAVQASWQSDSPQLGLVILMENADPIRSPAEVQAWHEAGVRIVGPAWGRTRYCGGTGAPGPLTADGRALIRELDQAGIILDVSHLAEESFWQALDLFRGPIIASHANCRALLAGSREDRHLSDAMLQALIAREAVIGIVLYNRFLDASWRTEQGKQRVGLEAVLRHIDHICELAGDTAHVAIGSDFDGGFGSEAIPRELDTIADLPRIAEALSTAGYSDTAVAQIMGGNWLAMLERTLAVNL